MSNRARPSELSSARFFAVQGRQIKRTLNRSLRPACPETCAESHAAVRTKQCSTGGVQALGGRPERRHAAKLGWDMSYGC